ncbi:MAG: carbon-nitrogen hydrolase family protein [Clostridiales Family XIII bacterium]|uniref:carbon-nitrogen hydrolase family protein n=1 Tax=Hominibacterium faecale TaxID=2839743 RepID=UPI0022B29D84|nr:carbon-nitrogen hydrolase family protein [Hominibacterium faecale]MCI7304616.1 carbon-nitrogen hydrolase family protein [Clostridia bacterium]MDE8733932.1 carbon-nitrogen hydrolase family protein [Eubacteriales bacterium DFI.9.88]MDY3012920.1 carbon-nitrogen hydrolase family protein [Clostridiales Family XIII bacterium]
MKKETIRITCAQMHSLTNEKRKNLDKMKQLADMALQKYPDTDLILFPELATTGCECTPEDCRSIAETMQGPSIKELSNYARDHSVFLVFGFIEKDPDTDKVYNSAALIDRSGKVLGQYRKMHLVEEEKPGVESGNSDYPVFQTEIGTIGIMICWDSAFPETARILALKGADYILIPAAWEKPQQHDWDLVQQARAFDNVIYTACCNQVGAEEILDFFGRSKLTGPNGQLLSEVVEDQEAIVSASFNYMDKEPLRAGYYALLKDRRPETYGMLLEKGHGAKYE